MFHDSGISLGSFSLEAAAYLEGKQGKWLVTAISIHRDAFNVFIASGRVLIALKIL